MIRRSFTLALLAGAGLLVAPMLAQAGGTITGKVTFSGKVPPPKEFAFSKFPNEKFCQKNASKSADGKTRLLKEVQIGKGGELKARDCFFSAGGISTFGSLQFNICRRVFIIYPISEPSKQ